MLDEAGFKGPDALSMMVMEPCFGDGTILSVIVDRMFEEGSREGLDADETLDLILTHVYGAEKDPESYAAAIGRLNAVLKAHGLEPADWTSTLYNEDICMICDSAKSMFDLVVGVPPYIPVKRPSTLSAFGCSVKKDALFMSLQMSSCGTLRTTLSAILFFAKAS